MSKYLIENQQEDEVLELSDKIAEQLIGYIPTLDMIEEGITVQLTYYKLHKAFDTILKDICDKFDCNYRLTYNKNEPSIVNLYMTVPMNIDKDKFEEYFNSKLGEGIVTTYNWYKDNFKNKIENQIRIYSKKFTNLYDTIYEKLYQKLINMQPFIDNTELWDSAVEIVIKSL